MSGPGLDVSDESVCVHCAATVVLLKSPLQAEAPTLWVHLPKFAQYCDLTATPEQPRDADGDPICSQCSMPEPSEWCWQQSVSCPFGKPPRSKP